MSTRPEQNRCRPKVIMVARGRGQRDTPPLPDDKSEAEVFFQRLDLLADGSRRYAQCLGRTVNRCKTPDSLECLHGSQGGSKPLNPSSRAFSPQRTP